MTAMVKGIRWLRDRRPRVDRLTAVVTLGALLVGVYAVPMVALASAIAPSDLLARLGDPVVLEATVRSLTTATISTLLAAALGIPLGYWLATTAARWAWVVFGLVLLPLVLPPTVAGVALLSVVGPTTALGSLATAGGLPLTGSLAGIVLAQTFVASPFVVITARAAFGGVDPHLTQAARTLGRNRWTTARRVVLPLAAKGILAGVTLAFARAMGEFGATMMLAYHPRTMPVQIWVSFISVGLEAAYPLAILLAGATLAALAVVYLLGAEPRW